MPKEVMLHSSTRGSMWGLGWKKISNAWQSQDSNPLLGSVCPGSFLWQPFSHLLTALMGEFESEICCYVSGNLPCCQSFSTWRQAPVPGTRAPNICLFVYLFFPAPFARPGPWGMTCMAQCWQQVHGQYLIVGNGKSDAWPCLWSLGKHTHLRSQMFARGTRDHPKVCFTVKVLLSEWQFSHL